MEKIMMKIGHLYAALALATATKSINITCRHYLYQEPIPESVKKLSKLK